MRGRDSFSSDSTYEYYLRIATTAVSQRRFEDILNFIRDVKQSFSQNPEKLGEFRLVADYISCHLKNTGDGAENKLVPDDSAGRMKEVLEGDYDLVGMLNSVVSKIEEENQYQKAMSFLNEVRQYLCSSTSYRAFLKRFHSYTIGEIGMDELDKVVTARVGNHPELLRKWKCFLDMGRQHSKKRKRWDFLMDLESGAMSPSYMRAPRDRNIKRDEVSGTEEDVLNHEYVLKPVLEKCGSDTESFGIRDWGYDEKEKFAWEDKRYEADMQLIDMQSAREYGEAKLHDKDYSDEFGKRILLQFVRHMYRNKEAQVWELYEINPRPVLLTLIQRLMKKRAELKHFINDYINVGLRNALTKYSQSVRASKH